MLKILVVDDHGKVLDLMTEILSEHNISTASNASEAIQKILQEAPAQFDAIISDYNMPEMDGVSFLEIAKNISPNTKRILMTCEEKSRFIIPIEKGTVQEFIGKPAHISEILSVVEKKSAC